LTDDLIEVYENAFEVSYCKKVIDKFEEYNAHKLNTQVNHLHKNNDNRIVFDWSTHNGLHHVDWDICEHFYKRLHDIYMTQYREKYNILTDLGPHSPKGMSVQKTSPGQGYHAWHCEAGEFTTANRLLVYSLFLNDVQEGGETEFLYQHKRIKPKTGSLMIWPASYTHPHRGNPPLVGEKYIITGWYTFDNIPQEFLSNQSIIGKK
jgi:hypothetical protein